MDQEASSADHPERIRLPRGYSRPPPAAGFEQARGPLWSGLHGGRSQLLRLVDVSAAGEEVVIQRSGRPVADWSRSSAVVPSRRRSAPLAARLSSPITSTSCHVRSPPTSAGAFCWASPRLVVVPRDARLRVPGLGGRGVRSARRARFAPKPQRADQPPATGSVSGRRRGLHAPRGSRWPPESSHSS